MFIRVFVAIRNERLLEYKILLNVFFFLTSNLELEK